MRPNFLLRFVAFLLFCGFLPQLTFPQDSASNTTTGIKDTNLATYPDTAGGLKNLLQELLRAVRSGDTHKTSQFLESLAIPNHGDWFVSAFGDAEGARLEAKYTELQAQSNEWFLKRVDSAAKNKKAIVEVSVYGQPQDATLPLLQATLRAMIKPVAVYSASVGENEKSLSYLAEFVYWDGAFRRVEREVLQALSTAPPRRVRVGGNVQRARLIHKVDPIYPELARESRAQGTVRLHVILATDGTVSQIEVISGDPVFQTSALEAVRQWRYQPTLLNGIPVEVDTMIDVIFGLR